MNKYIKLFLCVCFALFANCIICHASTSEALVTASYLEMYGNMFANTINSPYQAKQSDGYVDTSDANMTVNVEDLYIPGKNGLDLSIKRNFKTESSVMKYYYFEDENSSDYVAKCYSRVYLCSETNVKRSIYFNNEQEMIDAGDSFIGIHPDDVSNSRYKYYYSSLKSTAGEYTYILSDRAISEVEEKSKRRYIATRADFDGGHISMGNGWAIQVPALERYDVYIDGDYRTHYMVFHDRLGNIYNFNYELENYDDGGWGLYAADEPGWNPFVFEYVDPDDISVTAQHQKGFEYGTTITMKNGDIYYFGDCGSVGNHPKIVAIEDKAGNIITFNNTYNKGTVVEYTITDTYGATYTINNSGITKKQGDADIQLVKYEWNTVNSEMDIYEDFSYDDEYVFTVTKNTGNTATIQADEPHKTVYHHMQKYQYEEPMFDFEYLIYRLPYKVETPTGLIKNYEYNIRMDWGIGMFPDSGRGDFYYVSKYYETHGNKTSNITDYSYTFKVDGKDKNHICNSTEKYYDGETLLKTVETTYDIENRGNLPTYIKITGKTNGVYEIVENNYTYITANNYPTGLISQEQYTQSGYSHTKTYTYDSKGHLTKETNGAYVSNYTYHTNNYYLPHTQIYKKDASTTIKVENLLTTDGKGIATQNVYENDVLKTTTNFTYDTYGNISSASTLKDDGAYATINYTYTYGTDSYTVTTTQTGIVNADGTAVSNITTSKTYDYQNNLLSETDGKGNTTSYTYDNANRLTKVTYPDSTYDTYLYDILNNVTTLTTKTGAVYKVYFDGSGNAVKYTKGNQVIEQAEYDSIGRLLEYRRIYSTDNKTKVNYTYDYLDRIISETVYDNNTQISGMNYSYTVGKDTNNRITNTVTKNVITDNVYDSYATEEITYDYMGNAIKHRSHTADYELYTTQPERVYTYTYDYLGNMLTETDPKGNVNTYTYDYANRIASHTNAENNTKTYTYNKLGLLVSESDYDGNNITYTYDDAGRLLTISLPNGALTKSYYDANSNVIQTKTKSNLPGEAEKFDTVEYAYDSLNRLLYSVQYPSDNTSVYTNYEYSLDGTEMKIVYGNDTSSTSVLGTDAAQIQYIYDVYGNLVTMTSHDLTESYTYDLQGRMLTMSQGKTGTTDRRVETYAYNGFDSIIQKTATLPSGESETITYQYNEVNNRTSMIYDGIIRGYSYTPYGEVFEEDEAAPDNTYRQKKFIYDANGNRDAMFFFGEYSDMPSVFYNYDSLNRLTSVSSDDKTVSYTYDNNSNLLQTVKADGSIENYAYNNVNQLTQKTRTSNDTVKESYVYTYYLNGNIRTQNETLPKSVNHTYTYDGLGRLTNETVSGDYTRNDTYNYDKRGNRTSLVSLDAATTYMYNKNNQVLSLESIKADYTDSLTYTYDDYGNRIQRSGMYYGSGEWYNYAYDAFNRLDYVYASFGNTQTYTYDGDNLRQSIVDSYNGTTNEIYDGGNLIARVNGTNTHIYVYGLEQEFYISGTNSGIYSTNHRGDISKEISIDGTTDRSRAYSAYGDYIAYGYSTISPFGYAGEVRDDSGLIYLRNRYYDIETGTFLTQDPIKDGLNWYAYCAGNPVMFVDPWGLKLTFKTEEDRDIFLEHARGIYGIDDLDFKYEDDDKMIVVGTIGDYDDSQIGAMLLNLLIEDDVTYNINFQENVDVGGFTNVGNGIRVGLAMEVDSPTGTKMVSAPYYEVQARIIHECTHAYTYNKGYRAQVYNRVNSTYNDKFVIANHYQEATAIIVEERFRQEKGYPARDIEKYNGIGTDVNAYGMWPWDAAKVYGVSMSGYTQPLTLMETVFIWYDIQRNYERSKIK